MVTMRRMAVAGLIGAAVMLLGAPASSAGPPGPVRVATGVEKVYVAAALMALWSADPSLQPAPGCKIGLSIRQERRIDATVASRRECLSYDLQFTEGALALPSGQLRAIAAHELGHIKLGHRKASQETATLVARAFDRKQEDEADAFAVALLSKIGKAACLELAGTFRRMAQHRHDGGWLATHPASSDRAEQAETRCGTFSAVIPSVPYAATAPLDQWTTQFKATAQRILDRPHRKGPLPCDDGALADSSGYVMDVTDWAESAGLKRGDRFMSLAGIKTASADEWTDALARAPRGEPLDLEVERNGATVLLQLPCKDNHPQWEAEQSMLKAIVAERWNECIASARRFMSVVGRPFITALTIELRCFREKILVEKIEPAPDAYWRLMHRIGAAHLEVAKYRPGALANVRGAVLQIIDTLEKHRHPTLASDLRDQLTVASAP